MLTINILEKLINHNIIIYDSNAQYGVFTIRLMALMQFHCHNYHKTKIHKFYLPKDLYEEVVLNPDFKKHLDRIDYYPESMSNYFFEQKCLLAQYDAYLIIGVNKDYTNGILGSC